MPYAHSTPEHVCGEYANGWNAKSKRVVERISDLIDSLYDDTRVELPKLEVIRRLRELSIALADPVKPESGRKHAA